MTQELLLKLVMVIAIALAFVLVCLFLGAKNDKKTDKKVGNSHSTTALLRSPIKR